MHDLLRDSMHTRGMQPVKLSYARALRITSTTYAQRAAAATTSNPGKCIDSDSHDYDVSHVNPKFMRAKIFFLTTNAGRWHMIKCLDRR